MGSAQVERGSAARGTRRDPARPQPGRALRISLFLNITPCLNAGLNVRAKTSPLETWPRVSEERREQLRGRCGASAAGAARAASAAQSLTEIKEKKKKGGGRVGAVTFRDSHSGPAAPAHGRSAARKRRRLPPCPRAHPAPAQPEAPRAPRAPGGVRRGAGAGGRRGPYLAAARGSGHGHAALSPGDPLTALKY